MAQPISPKLLTATVDFIRDETPTVYTVRLKLPEGTSCNFSPGQYAMLKVPKDGKKLNKPYSIASSPFDTGYLDLCIKVVQSGFTSNYLKTLKPGDAVEMLVPMGNFFLDEHSQRDILMIAGGSGVAPMRSMLHYLFAKGTHRQVWLFFGNRTKEEIIYHQEFLDMAAAHPNFHYVPVLSRDKWEGEHGYVQHAIEKHLKNFANVEAYICGLTKLVEGNKAMLLGKGMDKHHVHHEVYV